MDEWGLEALELKACMVILGTKIEKLPNTHKLIGELGGFQNEFVHRPTSINQMNRASMVFELRSLVVPELTWVPFMSCFV